MLIENARAPLDMESPQMGLANYQSDLERSRSGRGCIISWSTGGVRSIHEGDRLFLLRQALDPRGIVAAGFAASDVYNGRHYDLNVPEETTYVDVDFHVILPLECLLPRAVLDEPPLAAMFWNTQRSGIEIRPRNGGGGATELLTALEDRWTAHLAALGIDGKLTTADGVQSFGVEGMKRLRTHEYKERDRGIVAAKKRQALSEFGELRCEVCGFVFRQVYGSIGEDFIECHHTVPLAQLSEGHRTTLHDLALVCSNCHRMLHVGRGTRSVEELRTFLQANGKLAATGQNGWESH